MCREMALTRGCDCEGSQDVTLINIFVNYIKSVVINSYGLLGYSCILPIWTTSVETLDGLWLYCYTGCMLVRAPRIKETLPDFCENMDPDKWDTTV